MSAGWLGSSWGESEASVIARHEWKGLSKMNYNLADYSERQRLQGAERQRQRLGAGSGNRVMAMPGSFAAGMLDDDF